MMSAVVPSASTRAYGWGSAAIWIVGPELSNRTKLVAVAWLGDRPAGASSAWLVTATGVPAGIAGGARGTVRVRIAAAQAAHAAARGDQECGEEEGAHGQKAKASRRPEASSTPPVANSTFAARAAEFPDWRFARSAGR